VVHSLSAMFREQARGCLPGSRLYASLLVEMADDLDAGGITAQVMAGRESDRPGTVPQLRLLGALHRLVLERRAPELAPHYPSVGGTAPVDAAWPAAASTMREHLDELRGLLDRTVQTNEPGRTSALYGALLVASQRAADSTGPAMPIRLLEVGASAGLTMLADRYGYAVGRRVLGDPASPLRLRQPWIGVPPADLDVPVRIVERRGCDPNPIDPTSTDGRLTLTSYVWADWIERVERLRAALRVAAEHQPPIDRATAADWLVERLREPRPGTLTVVWHSVFWQYLTRAEREEARAVVLAAAARSTTDAPLAHLSFEPRRLPGGGYRFELRLTRWPGTGDGEVLAVAPGHGVPTRWSPGPDGDASPPPTPRGARAGR
jgi:hypothetical protein